MHLYINGLWDSEKLEEIVEGRAVHGSQSADTTYRGGMAGEAGS